MPIRKSHSIVSVTFERKTENCRSDSNFTHIPFDRHYGNTHGKSSILTSGDLTSFMYQVARGMDYLSSRGVSISQIRQLSVKIISAIASYYFHSMG